MKFTTASAALAVAATGAAAQDSSSWAAWSSSSTSTSSKPVSGAATSQTCPATVTSVKTETTSAYEKTSEIYKATVSVPVQDKPASVPTVAPNWVDWDTASATGPAVTKVPDGCTPAGKTVTSTTTITSTLSGTTTVTKNTLYVGVQVTGDADASWAAWKPAETTPAATSSKPSGSTSDGDWNSWGGSNNGNGANSGNNNNGNGANGGWSGNGNNNNGNGNSNGGWSGNGNNNNNNGNNNGGWSGNGNSNGDGNSNNGNGNSNGGWSGNGNGNNNGGSGSWGGNGVQTSNSDGSNNNKGNWGPGSWGGKGTGGRLSGSNNQVFGWSDPKPSVFSSVAAPQYTQGPDGSWGAPKDQGWANWNGGSGNGNGGNGGSGGKGNSTGTTPVTNSTTPATNGTNPDYGSPSSNCTKPFEPLKEVGCNDASDRSKWCAGFDIDSDYYQNYFDQFNSSSFNSGNTGNFGGKGGFPSANTKTCSYDLTITNGTWNQDGTDVQTFLINGQFPGPAIECNWGDLVQITVHNQLQNNGTAIHWHGVRQVGTNDQDGVPGVTECATAPGHSRTYTWRASSYGTSWYHSHWGLQYGDGVMGPIIIHGPATANYDIDAGPVMISDTYGMTATAFGSIIAHVGPGPTVNYLLNGKNTAPDLSAGQHALWKVQKGKKYLFRLINSAAQNMYSVSIDQHKMQVISADFVPIVPYTTEWLNIGIGQRYDVIVEMNQAVDSYFFRAVTQQLCPSACTNTGMDQANGIIAYEGVSESPLLLPTSNVNGNKTVADFNICDDEPLTSLVPHLKKSAGTSTAFQASASTLPGGNVGKVPTSDDGLVFRWFLNNGAMYINYTQPTIQSLSSGIALNDSAYANPIVLNQQNQWVYFVIQNQFFAFHPMHLHGHDFSVLGAGDGVFTSDMVSTLNFDNPIRRDTAMLRGSNSPAATTGGYTVIGFETDNPGAWLMHCHIAWHVDGGLALQWIERPDDMSSSGYTSQSEFEDQCTAYASYEASGAQYAKFSGQSGLRRRELTYFDKYMNEASRQFNSVVRRDDHAKHFLDSHLKRGLGDGANRRTFGRRR